MDLFILVGVLALIIFIFSWIMRKVLRVERKKWFSNNYVNDIHKKYDIGLRVFSVFAIVIAVIFLIKNASDFSTDISFSLFLIGFSFTVVQELFRAYMEWKYVKEKNDYLFTLSQLIFIIALLVITWKSSFFGMLNL